MAKASDNAFPSLLVVEQASAPSTPSSGQARIYRKTDNNLYVKDDGGVESQIQVGTPSAGLGAIIARKAYNPASLATYSTSSTTAVDLDATNLAVTFTVPSSGNVLIRLSGITTTNNAAGQHFWALRESSSVIDSALVSVGTYFGSGIVEFEITGLTPAASKTYKFAHFSLNAGHSVTTYAGGGSVGTSSRIGAAVMVVYSLP